MEAYTAESLELILQGSRIQNEARQRIEFVWKMVIGQIQKAWSQGSIRIGTKRWLEVPLHGNRDEPSLVFETDSYQGCLYVRLFLVRDPNLVPVGTRYPLALPNGGTNCICLIGSDHGKNDGWSSLPRDYVIPVRKTLPALLTALAAELPALRELFDFLISTAKEEAHV